MIFWLVFCITFTASMAALVIWPLWRHPTLPRSKKLVLGGVLFLLLVPASLALYTWVGVPAMAVL